MPSSFSAASSSSSVSSAAAPPAPPGFHPLRRRSREDKSHWVADEKIHNCTKCETPFTLVFRKHHCRGCGACICQNCSHYADAEMIFETPPAAGRKRSSSSSNLLPQPPLTLTAIRDKPTPKVIANTMNLNAVRVCANCAVATHKIALAKEVPVKVKKAEDGILHTPGYVFALYEKAAEDLFIGSLSAVVVQARGLPAADVTGTSDPYVKLTLTGLTISGGQDWPEEMQTTHKTAIRSSTLDPIWGGSELFRFRVPRADAMLRVEVKDYDFGSPQDDMLGTIEIPLSDLLHQKQVDKWYTLTSPDDGEPAGEVRIILQYKYHRWGELFSRFWPEPPYVPQVVGFSPNRMLKNIKDVTDETKPYLNALGVVGSVMSWERPVVTLLVFGVVVALTIYPQYIYSFLQGCLIVHILANYIRRRGVRHVREVEGLKKKEVSLRGFLKERHKQGKGLVGKVGGVVSGLKPGGRKRSGSGNSNGEGGGADGSAASSSSSSSSRASTTTAMSDKTSNSKTDTSATTTTTTTDDDAAAAQQEEQEEQEGMASLGLLINFLGKRLGRNEATTNIQNALGMLALLLKSIRHLLHWEQPAATTIIVLCLLGSCILHLYISVTWLFILTECLIFQLLTWPLQVGVWYGVRVGRCVGSMVAQAKFTMQKTVPGEIVVEEENKGEGEKESKGGGVASKKGQ